MTSIWYLFQHDSTKTLKKLSYIPKFQNVQSSLFLPCITKILKMESSPNLTNSALETFPTLQSSSATFILCWRILIRHFHQTEISWWKLNYTIFCKEIYARIHITGNILESSMDALGPLWATEQYISVQLGMWSRGRGCIHWQGTHWWRCETR